MKWEIWVENFEIGFYDLIPTVISYDFDSEVFMMRMMIVTMVLMMIIMFMVILSTIIIMMIIVGIFVMMMRYSNCYATINAISAINIIYEHS